MNSVCPGARFSRNTLKWEFCWLSIIHHWGETCWWRYKTGIHFFQPGDVIFSESSCVPARPDQVDHFFRGLTLCSWSQLRRPYTLQCCTPAQDNRLYWIDHLSSADDTSITDLLWWRLRYDMATRSFLKTLGSLPPQLWNFGNLNIWQVYVPAPSWKL